MFISAISGAAVAAESFAFWCFVFFFIKSPHKYKSTLENTETAEKWALFSS